MGWRGRILVTGATGNVGRQVVAQSLECADVAVRATVRDPDTANLPESVEVVRGDLASPGTLDASLSDVDAVFLMWPLHTADTLPAVLDAIEKHARRLVFLGSGGVQGFTMDQQQELIARTSLEWTFIQPSTFAVNALWWAQQIQTGDVVGGAHGDLGMAMLHESDIAAVAVHVLTGQGHAGMTYRLTGPDVLTQAEQVRIMGEAIGRPLRWRELSRQEARKQLIADGLPLSFVDVLLDAYAAMATWPRPEITDAVARVTGSPARTFRQWAADHAEAFQAAD